MGSRERLVKRKDEKREDLGNPIRSRSDAETVVDVLKRSGAIEFAAETTQAYIRGGEVDGKNIIGALEYLERFNDTWGQLLSEWTQYLVNRAF